MWTLYKKELSNFFSSLIGYLTIAVFLVLTGLMLWVLKSDFNIMDYGYAGMDGLFHGEDGPSFCPKSPDEGHGVLRMFPGNAVLGAEGGFVDFR